MYITSNDGYQSFSVFAPIRNSLILDSNKEVIYWIFTGILPENIKPFDSNLELTMFSLANGKVILKFNNSVLAQIVPLHCIVALFQIYI